MKIIPRLALLLLLTATQSLWAAFESIKVEVTEEPQMPARLVMDGLRDGRVDVAIAVGADGRPVDWLVVSASHRELIKPCVESLQRWKYQPAQYDGQPVQAQLMLTISLSQTGAVVSRSSSEMITDMFERIISRPFDYQVCPVDEIDRQPEALATVSPRYAAQAAEDGIRGRVKVHFYIDEKGDVRMPAVAADAQPYLSSMAIEAVKGWKFQPATRSGRPVMVAAAQEFDFGGKE